MAGTKKEVAKESIFDIATAEPKSIIQISEFEAKQKELVKNNPFVKITDAKSYAKAKASRTALKEGRTSLQNQDKSLASVFVALRKKIGESLLTLIDITQPHETKQQEEIDRHEKEVQNKKDEEAKKEKEELDAFNERKELFENELLKLIGAMDFETMEATTTSFENEISKIKEEDFGLRGFMIDEAIETMRGNLERKKVTLKEAEQTRIANLEKEQEAKVNELFREGTELIDSANVKNAFVLLKALQSIKNVYDKFDFGKQKENANKTFSDLETKAKNKVKELEEKLIQDEKNANATLRESLLDMIFQMDLETRQEYEERISQALNQPLENLTAEAKEDFRNMAVIVNKSLVRKQSELDKDKETFEIERKERFKRLESEDWTKNTTDLFGVATPLNFDPMKLGKEEFEDLIFKIRRNRNRFIELDKIGIIIDLNRSSVVYYDETVAATLFIISNSSDEDFKSLVDKFKTTIEEKKKADKEFQERQELLKPKKEILIEQLKKLTTYQDEVMIPGSSVVLGLEDLYEYNQKIESELEVWIQKKIEEINAF